MSNNIKMALKVGWFIHLSAASLFIMLVLSFGVQPANADPFSKTIAPSQTFTFEASSFRHPFVEVTFNNDTGDEVCLDVSSRGFTGKVCVPANGQTQITELFDGTVTIVNKSTVASIRIHGRWL